MKLIHLFNHLPYSINHPTVNSINQSINPSTTDTVNQLRPSIHLINHSINQSQMFIKYTFLFIKLTTKLLPLLYLLTVFFIQHVGGNFSLLVLNIFFKIYKYHCLDYLIILSVSLQFKD